MDSFFHASARAKRQTGIWQGEYALSSRGRKLQRSQPANRLGRNNKQFAPVTWMSPTELPGKRKPAAVRKNELAHFLRSDTGFPCALCAQQGRLRRPARKRGTTLLLQFAFAAFTATNGVFCFSFDSKEKRPPPRQIPVFSPIQFLRQVISSLPTAFPQQAASRRHNDRTCRTGVPHPPATANQWTQPRFSPPLSAAYRGFPAWDRAAAYFH